MKPETAYRRLNTLLWMGRLPDATIKFVDDETLPRGYGITLFDADFAKPVIFLNDSYSRWGRTLIHEMLHVSEPILPHGRVFDAIVNSYWRRAKKAIRGLK